VKIDFTTGEFLPLVKSEREGFLEQWEQKVKDVLGIKFTSKVKGIYVKVPLELQVNFPSIYGELKEVQVKGTDWDLNLSKVQWMPLA
jgi:hypothetical protein